MIDNNKEYILCAAIKRKTPREGEPYWKGTNDIMDIEIGYRHHDIFNRFKDGEELDGIQQGFYTSKGRFVDRVEALEIAYKAGQVTDDNYQTHIFDNGVVKELKTNKLYSEQLY